MSRKWHKGPPPFPGWWNARRRYDIEPDSFGWFDGVGWSAFAFPLDLKETAALQAKVRGAEYYPDTIEWSEYWPKNARVPRIDPRKVK